MTNSFQIVRRWLSRRLEKGDPEVKATVADLRIHIADRNVTEFRSSDGEVSDHLQIPLYFISEWMAENWWPLLWEPRKREDQADDPDFLLRHSLLVAGQGFALPKVLFVPLGRNIHISAVAREVQLADIRFLNGARIFVSRAEVESTLKEFIKGTVDQLAAHGLSDTSLQAYWDAIESTTSEEFAFCRFMGALGLSPYIEDQEVEQTLARVVNAVGEDAVLDLCLASTRETLQSAAVVAEKATAEAQSNPPSTLEPLSTVHLPPDNERLPAWHRGVKAAERVRSEFGIKDLDAAGADHFFELLKIDPRKRSEIESTEGSPIVGAVVRQDQTARMALLQHTREQRRFAAARAAYSAWSSPAHSDYRLLTQAVTRDQQASRAFAAELTAPLPYLRANSKRGKLSQDLVYELAHNLNIGPDVVMKHAQNSGLQISPF